jgi:hypothetical protein
MTLSYYVDFRRAHLFTLNLLPFLYLESGTWLASHFRQPFLRLSGTHLNRGNGAPNLHRF